MSSWEQNQYIDNMLDKDPYYYSDDHRDENEKEKEKDSEEQKGSDAK
jgi:hypothetical protein